MRWRAFALWNAAGGIAWATTVGLLAFALGRAARTVVAVFGLAGAATVLVVLAVLLLRRSRAQTRARIAGIHNRRVSNG